MKHLLFRLGLLLFFIGLMNQQAQSQSILRKIQNKAEDKVVQKIFKEGDQPPNENAPSENAESGNTGPTNTKGAALENSAPNVNESIEVAEKAANDKNYAGARDATRKALLGVEIEIGKQVLNDLPNEAHQLPKVEEEDNVTSTGVGFVGLVIKRVYRKADQQLEVMIANDAGMFTGINMYWASGAYSTAQDPNRKEVSYKGYKALMVFDESSGYSLNIPFGQTSLLVFDGINFENEQEIMDAANEFDIEKIKKQLGEQ
jgi:DNA-directed RNA polymerase subunit H (RpoH/RPB5)